MQEFVKFSMLYRSVANLPALATPRSQIRMRKASNRDPYT